MTNLRHTDAHRERAERAHKQAPDHGDGAAGAEHEGEAGVSNPALNDRSWSLRQWS